MSHDIPKNLIEQLEQNNVIPFVGAGISLGVLDKNSDPLYLGWKDLLLSSTTILRENGKDKEANFIKAYIDVAKTSEDYMTIADKIKEALSSQWQDFLNNNFDKSFDDVDEETLKIPKEIWHLGKLIVTTNYDKVMTWSNNSKDLVSWDIKATAGQLDSLKSSPEKETLWHLHGKIDNLEDIVLTKCSYETVYGETSESKVSIETLKFHMATKSFIFLGFSLDDVYLREQLKKVKTLFGEFSGPHYILLKEEQLSDLSELGDIRPIFVKDYKDDYLRALKELTKYKSTKIVQNTEKRKEALEIKKHQEILPFNIPFQSKEDGAIGIQEKLEEVHEALCNSSKTSIGQSLSFLGMGGLGKTQLAVEYVHRYKSEYESIVWLTLDQNMDEQLLELAQKCYWVEKNIDAKVKLSIAKDRYSKLQNTLFVFDNVDDIKDVEEFFIKSSTNRVLITSRNPIQGFIPIALTTLNEENSLKLLTAESKREIKTSELADTKELCELLEGLPLALEMAGAYVAYLECSWGEYLELFKHQGIFFLQKSDIRSYTEHENNIAKTLSLSDSLLKSNPPLEEVIHLLAWGSSEVIDKKLISIELGLAEVDLIEPLLLGVKLRFITKSDDGYTLHRLVRDIYREKEGLDNSFATKVSTNLYIYMKKIKDEFLELRELDKASIQATTWATQIEDKLLKAILINYSAYPNFYRGKYRTALDQVESVFNLLKDEEDSDIYAELLNSKGTLLNALGKTKDAKAYHLDALNMRKRLYPNTDHPDIANSLNNVGFVLDDVNDQKAHYIDALNMSKRLFPNTDHSDTADYLNNIGSILTRLGKVKEANVYSLDALNMRKRLYPNSDHPDIARSLNNVGYVLDPLEYINKKAYYLDKKTYYLDALNMYERLFPNSDHPDIANSLNNIGSTLDRLGKLQDATKYFKEAYHMSVRVFGENNKDTVERLSNYAAVLYKNPANRKYTLNLLEEHKKGLKGDKELLTVINNLIEKYGPNVNRNKSKRKKR